LVHEEDDSVSGSGAGGGGALRQGDEEEAESSDDDDDDPSTRLLRKARAEKARQDLGSSLTPAFKSTTRLVFDSGEKAVLVRTAAA